ncbi:hypothetical protein [Candidatus Solirubrobacter pratensis]|uniref:hypothetical protein n=1 Tax=Candidatus Solirubrobacter pratensis TaxID=1298857 RepID=UPI00040D159A|nr:hypothetical protein [Candidatus Solirubrobacter pratensis]
MSTTDPGHAPRREYSSATESYYVEGDRGYGWVSFAGVMLSMLAVLNFIDGVAAVSNSSFFACLFALDIIVIYALVVHGARRRT